MSGRQSNLFRVLEMAARSCAVSRTSWQFGATGGLALQQLHASSRCSNKVSYLLLERQMRKRHIEHNQLYSSLKLWREFVNAPNKLLMPHQPEIIYMYIHSSDRNLW